MNDKIFIVLGLVFLVGLATDILGRKTSLPRVTLLLVFGVMLGSNGIGLIKPTHQPWLELASQIALVMVGFLLGGHLRIKPLKRHGRLVISLSVWITVATMLAVGLGLLLLGVPLPLALLLGAMATATDPAATLDVIRENKAAGPFSATLIGVVAVDDIWGLVVFSLTLTVLDALMGGVGFAALLHGALELGGSVLLGLGLGLPMAALSGRIQKGEPTQAEALGFVCLCTGLAIWLGLSYLIAAIVMGASVANLARHHKYPFHAIEGIEWPFLILFFVFAGASLNFDALRGGGVVLLGYLVLRISGRVMGAYLGARLGGSGQKTAHWYGLALLPQAGVAIGMALIAAQKFPAYANQLLSLAMSSTIIFELLGPILTRRALRRQGERDAAVTSKGAEVS